MIRKLLNTAKVAVIILLALATQFSYGQNLQSKKGPIIVCPAETVPNELYIPRSNSSHLRTSGAASDIFEVEYVGFSEEAQVAFQYAVDIWESILKTDVKIRVQATWEPLGTGVLGSAGASVYYRDFENAPIPNTFYPVALAEKLAGQELNSSEDFDIEASFNSEFSNWYLGTDGQGSGQYDLVSVVLHELGHGLGFISGENYDESNNTAQWDLSDTGFPMVFTSFLEDGEGVNILDVANGTEELGTFLTSSDVFVSTDLVNISNSGPAKIFAPSPYDPGSSISHWDESTFNNTPNALMTPAVAPSEVIHDPGILTLGFFADMGWFRTNIEHSPVLVAEASSPLKLQVLIKSDTALIDEDFVVNVFYADGDTVAHALTEVSNGLYSVQLTPDPTEDILSYYFDGLSDAFDKTYRVPETGSYEVTLTSIPTISVPFSAAGGGDFESGTANFITTSNIAGEGLWEHGDVVNKFDNYASTAWVTSLRETMTSPEQAIESALISPLFDLTDLGKDYNLSFDYLGDFSDFDVAAVYYSLDTGLTWSKLGHAYDDLGISWYQQPIYGDFFSGQTVDSEGVFAVQNASYPLYELAGNAVMFKISHQLLTGGDPADYGNDGMLIDNFEVSSADPAGRFYSVDTTFNFPEDEIHFYYASSGAQSYDWDFGDGSGSDQQNPVHVYTTGGSYNVSLTVTHANGSSTFTRENYIQVISQKGRTYLVTDGGDFETVGDFIPVNVAGTGFQRGSSTVTGKDGTNSGSFAWVTGLTDATYDNDSEAYLYSPEFDFTIIGDYQMSFYAKYSFENLWDGFIVEYTLDRGQTWIKLDEQVRDGWYDALSDPNAVFGSEVPIFTGATDGFEQKTVDVGFLGGESTVSFRFTFLTDAAEIDAGLALDDFELIGPEEGAVVPDFSSSLTFGQEGCAGVSYTFTNESTGSIYDMTWFFGENATPIQASGPGPHVVEFSTEGTYEVVLTAIDQDQNPFSTDTTIVVSSLHTPAITQTGSGATVELTLSQGDSYQWYLEGEILTGATQQVYSATESGVYSGEVTVGQCTVLATAVSIIASADSEIVSAYPNPTYDELYLHLKESAQVIVVSDMAGRIVLQKELDPGQRTVVLSQKWRELEQGLYILTFKNQNELVGSLKVLKK